MRQDACENLPCLAKKLLAVGHIANYQTSPNLKRENGLLSIKRTPADFDGSGGGETGAPHTTRTFRWKTPCSNPPSELV